MKKGFIIFLKLIALCLIILLCLAVEFGSIIGFIPFKEFLRIPIYLILGSGCFLLFKAYFPSRWNKKKQYVLFILATLLFLIFFEGATYVSDRRVGGRQFSYRFGNCTEIFRGVLNNDFAESSLERVFKNLNFLQRYVVYSAGDACRVFRIKDVLQSEDSRKFICKDWKDKSSCFKEVLIQTIDQNPYTETGMILSVAVGATSVFEEKNLGDKKVILSTLEKKKWKALNEITSIFKLHEVLAILVYQPYQEQKMLKIFSDFPYEKILKIPESVKNEIDSKLIQESTRDEAVYSALLGSADENFKTFSLEEDVLNAYLVLAMDKSFHLKGMETGCSRLGNLFDKAKEKLNSTEYLDFFNEKELRLMKKRAEKYSSLYKTCKMVTKNGTSRPNFYKRSLESHLLPHP